MPKREVRMELARTTKNTYRFEEADENGPIRVLYIQQAAFPGGAPAAIVVTFEADNA
ncbi:hypothetical protein LCGC14_1245710 [marine sediment metagenome]|uniref:Uncharacterized protein n=1 Tax=marine sediment metagenome TaxID=412755 RepID=A0A0F9L4H9_9ZZZZ